MSGNSLTYRLVGNQVSMRDRLLVAAAQLFSCKGYHATSLSDIAELCGLQKASIFHYFPSKQAIAIETIDVLHQYCYQKIFHLATEANQSPELRIINFITAIHDFMLERFDAGLVSFLAMELIDVLPAFNQPILNYFDTWLQTIVLLLSPLHGEEQAQLMSKAAMLLLQGSLVMSRVMGDSSYLRQCTHQLLESWRVQ